MSTAPYRIIVGVDFSETSVVALNEAVALAAAHYQRSELHLAAVVDSDHAEWLPTADRHASLVQIADHTRERLNAVGDSVMASLRERFPKRADIPLIAHVRVGAIAEQIASLANEIGANVVVVGTHGRRGVKRFVMGSVAEKTVRLAPCPVLVVRPRDFHEMEAVPRMEPACAACIATREKTAGAQWWCDTHTKEPDPVHIYSRSGRLDQPLSPAPFGSF